MTGRITLEERDCRRGYENAAAIPIALRAAIDIRDIDRFIADGSHAGEIAGHLYVPRLGGILPGTAGVFRLFAPTDDPSVTEMVYELGCKIAGKPAWLRGRKYVRTGRPWRLWPETTTLHVTLHDGPGEAAPIIGAGILRLGIIDLVALLGTLRATGSERRLSRMRSIWRFAAFFAGELWRSYVVRRAIA
jgi:hypothetical protein